MLDLHTHILHGMDDGSRSLKQSIAMLRREAKLGVDRVVCTPHFYAFDESPERFLERRSAAMEALDRAAAGKRLPERIAGAEVAYFGGISRAEGIERFCIGNTRAMLIEMPFCRWDRSVLDELIFLKMYRGINPILAHVERYMWYQPPGTMDRLSELGIRTQVNATFFLRWQTSLQAMRIQELVIAWGIPGLAIFVWLWAVMIVRSRKENQKRGLIHYIPLLVILLKVQAGQMLNSAYTMLTFSFAYLSMCADLPMGNMELESAVEVPDRTGVSFGRVVKKMLRKWWIIGAAAVLCGVSVYEIDAHLVEPMYKSSAMFYINNSFPSEGLDDSTSNDDIWVSRNLADTCEIILKSRSFLDEVLEHTGLEKSYAELSEMISFEMVNETEIFRTVVEGPDPAETEIIANGIADLLPEHFGNLILGTSTRVVERAVAATKPSYPNKAMDTMIGCVFGFVLCAALILLSLLRNRKISALEDIEELMTYPLLAEIPDIYKKRAGL